MKAQPLWANIYLRFRESDYGKTPLPGFEVETVSHFAIFNDLEAALRYVRELHDDHMKRKP